MSKEKIIGIDLGTQNSAASVLQAGRPTIVPSAEGASLYGKAFPSFVAFTKDGNVLVGEPARRQAVSNPEGTVYGAKRKMGTSFKYKIHGKEYSPQQISAYILQKIKRDAEEFLGEKVNKAVITVPAYFDDNQRQATKDAGQIAGLEVVRIINEPTAAALAFGLDKQDKDSKILVFDLGAGTLDVTIMELGDGVFEVKSTSGDTQLGGQREHGIDLNEDKIAIQRVREAAEKAKIELSTVTESEINLPFIHGQKNFRLTLTRAKLEELIDPIVARCKKPLMQAVKDAKLDVKDIHKIILVGGPTRMPVIRNFVEGILGRKAERGIDPMECVANGAAIQGGVLSGEVKDILLLDVTPLTLGIETLGGIKTALIQRNTTIPTKKSQVFSTAEDNQGAVTIHVLQGEREMASDNKSLGRFDLMGIPPAPRGIPQIEVTFDIDASGIIHVSAKDLGTGKEQKIKITAENKLSEKEVERMRKDAEEFAEEDKKKKEKAEVKNQADSLVYTIDKSLKEFEGKISEEDIKEIKKEKEDLKNKLAGGDTEEIKFAMEKLNKKLHDASTKLYEKAQKEEKQAKDHEVGKNGKKDKVVDAEVVKEEEE